VAEMLIAGGSDVNEKDNQGMVALDQATNKEVAEFLISKGSPISAGTKEKLLKMNVKCP
jgi:hypothetical protein